MSYQIKPAGWAMSRAIVSEAFPRHIVQKFASCKKWHIVSLPDGKVVCDSGVYLSECRGAASEDEAYASAALHLKLEVRDAN